MSKTKEIRKRARGSYDILNNLFAGDGGAHGLSFVVSARSGSGKTVLLSHLIQKATSMDSLRNTRFLYVTLKRENPFPKSKQTGLASTLGEVLKSVSKNRVTVFSPGDPSNYSGEIDELLESMCYMAENNEDCQVIIILDDANILDGFDNRGVPSPAVKKAILAGRSMGLKVGLVTHRLGNLPRIINGNASSLLVLDINEMDSKYSSEIFGVNMDEVLDGLGGFRWAYVDLVNGKTSKFNPVPFRGH